MKSKKEKIKKIAEEYYKEMQNKTCKNCYYSRMKESVDLACFCHRFPDVKMKQPDNWCGEFTNPNTGDK